MICEPFIEKMGVIWTVTGLAHPIILLSRENLLKEKSIDRMPAFFG